MDKQSDDGTIYWKKWLKYFKITIILFPILFCVFGFFFGFIVIGFPPISRLVIIDFYGYDNNNDTAVDTVEIVVINSGDKKEEITDIDFSLMDKEWILINFTFPIELSQFTSLELQLTFVAVTDQEQITATDEIHVVFFLAREGTDPAIIIDNDDLLRDSDGSFSIKEGVTLGYYKKYSLEPYQFIFTLSFMASFIIIVALNVIIIVYLLIGYLRSTMK